MDGVPIIGEVRYQFIINPKPQAQRLIAAPQRPPPKENNRCLNTFAVLTYYTVGLGSIILGSINLSDCPAEKKLPTSLIVLGGMIVSVRLLNIIYDFISICEDTSDDIPKWFDNLNVFFTWVEVGMFIAVCYWAFTLDATTKPEDHLKGNYCNHTLSQTSLYACIGGIIYLVVRLFRKIE